MTNPVTSGAVAFAKTQAALGGYVPQDMTEQLADMLDGRRVLVVANDADLGDMVEAAFRDAGLPVRRLRADQPLDTETSRGMDVLPAGQVVVVDGGAFDALCAARTVAMTSTLAALMRTVDDAKAGSADDHVLMITAEEAMLDAAHVLNRLMDGFIEADLVREGLHRSPLDALASLFGDDVPGRDRSKRAVYRLREDSRVRFDAPLAPPERIAGFDYRAENEAYNRRTGPRGGRGDQRTNRGGRGRR